MGLSTHSTHIYGAQHPQHPHLWGSAPTAPQGGRSPTSGCGSVPSGGSEGLHPPPPPHSGPPPHTAPPLPPPRGTAALPRHGGRGLKRVGVASKEMGVASISAIISPPKGRGLKRWAWPKRRRGSAGGVVTGSGRGLRGRRALPHKLHNVGLCPITETRDPTAPWALPHNQPYVGLSPITAPMWGSAP